MICPLHRTNFVFGESCPDCDKQNLIVHSVEFDKQDRVISTMRYLNHEFLPHRSRAILVFEKKDKGEKITCYE